MRRRQLLLLAPAAAALSLARAQPGPREIEIVAERFRFLPNQITLRAGEPVVLLLKALDFAHGFYIPDLGQRVDLMPGSVVKLPLTPQMPGTLPFVCDNFCGDGHEGMDGHFIVTA